MQKGNLHVINPPLFKAINDIAKDSEFQEVWTLKDMTDFLMNVQFLEKKTIEEKKMPSLEDLVLLFETLDSDKDGLLSQSDIRSFVENVD